MAYTVTSNIDDLINFYKNAAKSIEPSASAGVEMAMAEVYKEFQNTFRLQQANGWPPISTSWHNWKVKNHFSPMILIMTGQLMGNFTYRRISRFVGSVYLRDVPWKPPYLHFLGGSKLRKHFRNSSHAKAYRAGSGKTTGWIGNFHEEHGRPIVEPTYFRSAPAVFRILKQAVISVLKK